MFLEINRTNGTTIFECVKARIERTEGRFITFVLDVKSQEDKTYKIDVEEEKDIEGVYLLNDKGDTISVVWRRNS